MTFALGRRFIDRRRRRAVEGEGPRAAQRALTSIPPDTTVAFFAREDTRAKAPKGLHEAVRKAGGDISAEESVKPWELPKWVIARARRARLRLDPMLRVP